MRRSHGGQPLLLPPHSGSAMNFEQARQFISGEESLIRSLLHASHQQPVTEKCATHMSLTQAFFPQRALRQARRNTGSVGGQGNHASTSHNLGWSMALTFSGITQKSALRMQCSKNFTSVTDSREVEQTLGGCPHAATIKSDHEPTSPMRTFDQGCVETH